MKNFDFFLGIRLGHLVLSHSDNLSATLQTPNASAAEAQKLSRDTQLTQLFHFEKKPSLTNFGMTRYQRQPY